MFTIGCTSEPERQLILCGGVSGCVSSCLQVGMVTPRDLLQRIEEVDPGRINETRKAMRLYAHFKHGYVGFAGGRWQSVPPVISSNVDCP